MLPLDVLSRIVHALEAVSFPPEGVVPSGKAEPAGRGVPAESVAARGHVNGWLAAGETGRSAKREGFGGAAPSCDQASDGLTSRNGFILSEAKNLWSEFTVEVNPEDIIEKGDEYVLGLKSLGVNRISMGVQSFDDSILRWMNRRHTSAAAVEAFSILRRCGIGNISLDLIFGLPQLTDEVWSDTIDRALALAPEHISAYQLSVEEDSALERMIAAGRFKEAPEDQCARQYALLCERLSAAGYRHYEISNFAVPGREAVHNSAYWRRVPYVGLGPGAHSLSGARVRSWNSEEIPRRSKDGILMTYSSENEKLTPEDIRIERIMLPLRTDGGIPESELRSLADPAVVDLLLSEGALVRSEGYLRIPESRFFTSDDIIRQLV